VPYSKCKLLRLEGFFLGLYVIFHFSLRNLTAQNARNSMSLCYRDGVNQLAKLAKKTRNAQLANTLVPSSLPWDIFMVM